MYAHVATDPEDPGKLALQYWFFYAFNDFNNLHEGDWEMIQLELRRAPMRARRSPAAGRSRLQLTRRRRASGLGRREARDRRRHASRRLPGGGLAREQVHEALYLGSSAEAGVGCDDTEGPHDELRPVVETIPSDPAAAQRAFPWIAFQGRWGELQKAFFNGPTGPNLKTQWTQPIEWSEELAGPQLRGADRRRPRDERHRLLLRGGGERARAASSGCSETRG